jgi:hypothetical protein
VVGVGDRNEERRFRAFCKTSSSTSKCIGEGNWEGGEVQRGWLGEMGLIRTASAIGGGGDGSGDGGGDGDLEGTNGGSGRTGGSRWGDIGRMMTTSSIGGGGGGDGGNDKDAASASTRDSGSTGSGVRGFGAGGSDVAGIGIGEAGWIAADMTFGTGRVGLSIEAARLEMRGFRLKALGGAGCICGIFFGGAGCGFGIIFTGAGCGFGTIFTGAGCGFGINFTGAGCGFGVGFGLGGSEVCLLCSGVYVRVGVGVSRTLLGGIAAGGIEPTLSLFVLCTTGFGATGTAASLIRLIITPSFLSSRFLKVGVSRPVCFLSNGFDTGVCARATTGILCTPGSSI